jgi:hypothetical protein
VKAADPLDLEDVIPPTGTPQVPPQLIDEDEGWFTLGSLVKIGVFVAVIGGIVWWLGGMRILRRYIPGLGGREGRYRRVGDVDLEK